MEIEVLMEKKLNKYKEIEATDVQKYNRNNVKKI
jgi:hypothetical protein